MTTDDVFWQSDKEINISILVNHMPSYDNENIFWFKKTISFNVKSDKCV